MIGKILPDAYYFHISLLPSAPAWVQEVVQGVGGLEYSVLKVLHNKKAVSFLNYPRFFEEDFPVLVESHTLSLASKKLVTRRYQKNRPILHRKELLVSEELRGLCEKSSKAYEEFLRENPQVDLKSIGRENFLQGVFYTISKN